MTTLTREQENSKMLAALLGIEEEEALQRLEAMVLVTHAHDEASTRIAQQIKDMLARTVCASTDEPARGEVVVEIIVGNTSPRIPAVTSVWVGSIPEGILVSKHSFSAIPASEHPTFGLIAACYACAMALRFALGRGFALPGHDRIVVSPIELLGNDLPLISVPCELGVAVLAGAGAVGNGLLYALQHFDIFGQLHIVDPKSVRNGNLNRCVWYIDDDMGKPKAPAIVKSAQRAFPNLKLLPHVATIKEFYRSEGAPPLTRLITTVDSRRARRGLQSEIPHQVFDASTTGIAEVVLHFNEQPTDLACLSCIYHQESGELAHEAHVAEVLGVAISDVKEGFITPQSARAICRLASDLMPGDIVGRAYDTLFKERCAAGKLRTAEQRQVLAPFCFVSMLAGSYLALEVVRRVNTGRISAPFNYWRVSPWHAPVPALRAIRERLKNCEFCGEPTNRTIARKLWAVDDRTRPTISEGA